MNLVRGLLYNLRGLWLGIRTPKLLFLGLFRFLFVIIIALALAGMILAYHREIMEILWTRPESRL